MGDQAEFLLKCIKEGKLTSEQAFGMLGGSNKNSPSTSEVRPTAGGDISDMGPTATTGALALKPIERKTCIYM